MGKNKKRDEMRNIIFQQTKNNKNRGKIGGKPKKKRRKKYKKYKNETRQNFGDKFLQDKILMKF